MEDTLLVEGKIVGTWQNNKLVTARSKKLWEIYWKIVLLVAKVLQRRVGINKQRDINAGFAVQL